MTVAKLRAYEEKPFVIPCLLTVLVLLFPLASFMQYLCAAVLFALVLVCPFKLALSSYVFMFFVDEVTVMDALGGSVVRIMQIALLIRFVLEYIQIITKEKKGAVKHLYKSDVLIGLFAAWAIVVGLLSHGLSGETASFAVNVGLFLLMRPLVRKEGTDEILTSLIRFYVMGALAACAVGLVHGRFVVLLFGENNSASYLRFKGTNEPNFMAAYLGTAIMLHINMPKKNWWSDALVTGILGAGLLLTYSMTGMLCFMISGIILLIVNRKEIKAMLTRIGLALPVVLLCFALVTGYVSWRGADAFDRGMIYDTVQDDVLVITPEGYEQIQQGADYRDVATPISELRSIEKQDEVVQKQEKAMYNQTQSSALLVRITEAFERIKSSDLDALTSGRYGLLRMKLSDFALLKPWQKLLGTGPDAVMTYQPNAKQMNYTHNSYADMLYSYGILGLLVILMYIALILKQSLFCGVRMTGHLSRALTMGRITLFLCGLTLSLHISRTLLFFILG